MRQVVEEVRGFLEEQRQVVLDSRGCQTAGVILVDRAAPVVDVEALAEAATLFDYLPQDTQVFSLPGIEQAAEQFWNDVRSRYEEMCIRDRL